MKTLRLLSCIGLGLFFVGCSLDEEEKRRRTVAEFLGHYKVDVELSSTLAFDIEGLTTNKAFPSTSTKGILNVNLRKNNYSEADMLFHFIGRSFGEIESVDWHFNLHAYDFHSIDGQSEPAYHLKSGAVSSGRLAFNQPLDKAVVRWVKGPNFTLETTFNLPVSVLLSNLDTRFKDNLNKALQARDHPTTIPVQLKVISKNAVEVPWND